MAQWQKHPNWQSKSDVTKLFPEVKSQPSLVHQFEILIQKRKLKIITGHFDDKIQYLEPEAGGQQLVLLMHEMEN